MPSATVPGARPAPAPMAAATSAPLTLASSTPVASPVASPIGPVTTSFGGTPPAGVAPAAAPAARKPINPFLANDPNTKAKRLARALVSDMVAYHPQKRDEGLRGNTLKQLFREDIKKSYEEYVDQVGREIAEGTSHFQDALNDLLAGGKKLF